MGIALTVLEATKILRRVVDNAGAVRGFVMYTEPKIIEENKWQLGVATPIIRNQIYPGIVRLLVASDQDYRGHTQRPCHGRDTPLPEPHQIRRSSFIPRVLHLRRVHTSALKLQPYQET